MIYRYSHENLSRWNKDEFKVQLDVPRQQLPMGWCDGTEEDEEELRAMAEAEGVDNLPIHKKYLWTGREIWTLGNAEVIPDEEDIDLDD